jgi:putative transposase
MVAAVRSGQPQRAVARAFSVSLATVQFWLARAGDKALDQVDWEDGSHRPAQHPRETPEHIQKQVIEARAFLKDSDLGEYGAQAIRDYLSARFEPTVDSVPSIATINRILSHRGVFDGRRRVRRKPPLPGWYLPDVASAHADIDELDFVEGLYLESSRELVVLNLMSLHGGLCSSWLNENMRASFVRTCLEAHWRAHGLPKYAQFDNGNMFAGPRQFEDAIGTVIRMCLSLGVTPVFSVPNEFGIQASIESYNNQWQQKVWRRFHFESKEQAQARSDRYVNALRQKRKVRQESAPARREFPADWQQPTQLTRTGRVIFLRRTTGQGTVEILKRKYSVDDNWCHRLVRCEIDLDRDQIYVYGLRRQDPTHQPLLRQWEYRLPDKRKHGSD